ncbi:MAG: hypothetical protein ACRYFK_10180 [Janthinobacterium lividum]
MQPTNNAPKGAPGAAPAKSQVDAPLSTTESTSGPTGSSYESYTPKADAGIQAILDSGKQAVDSGKKWLADSDLADKAKELPQKAKALGNKALDSFNALTTTQKAVGIGVLAAGAAFLLTRGSRKQPHGPGDKSRGRHSKDDFFGHQPHTRKGNEPVARGQRPWGTSRFGGPGAPAPGAAGPSGKPRVQAGSGPGSQGPRSNNRRDQGPANGSRYDARTSGHQNPNNLDDLSSAF